VFAYPAEFRQEYGEEMERLFENRLAEEPQVRLWLEVLSDVMITAPGSTCISSRVTCGIAHGCW